jgi:hypothetical protein
VRGEVAASWFDRLTMRGCAWFDRLTMRSGWHAEGWARLVLSLSKDGAEPPRGAHP